MDGVWIGEASLSNLVRESEILVENRKLSESCECLVDMNEHLLEQEKLVDMSVDKKNRNKGLLLKALSPGIANVAELP